MMVLKKASRHPGIKAGKKRPVGNVCRARIVRSSSSRPSGLLRGFSLIEVLMSIFILAIGIISITALFPAGIAQQRHAIDDMMGPVVADNAMTLLRSKLRPEHFGPDDVFSPAPLRTLQGDWEWRRPAFFFEEAAITYNRNGTNYDSVVPPGSISIFKHYSGKTTDLDITRIPWNEPRFGDDNDDAPAIILTQRERFYPLTSGRERPQFMWECMFRRFQGRILVAIFVYRVTSPGGGGVPYRVVATDNELPPLPIMLDFKSNIGFAWNAEMGANIIDPADPSDPNIIPGTARNTSPYDPANDDTVAWQLPGQMILDQNNIVHQVLVGREFPKDGPLVLTRPVAPVLGYPFGASGNFTESPFHYLGVPGDPHPDSGATSTGMVQEGVVTRIWYLPEHMRIIVNGILTTYTIKPVYITVREL